MPNFQSNSWLPNVSNVGEGFYVTQIIFVLFQRFNGLCSLKAHFYHQKPTTRIIYPARFSDLGYLEVPALLPVPWAKGVRHLVLNVNLSPDMTQNSYSEIAWMILPESLVWKSKICPTCSISPRNPACGRSQAALSSTNVQPRVRSRDCVPIHVP
jgi:hypothetical protein